MLESVQCSCCTQWHLRFFGGKTRYKRDDAGNALSWPTKKAAEAARIVYQQGSSGWPANHNDHFRGKH